MLALALQSWTDIGPILGYGPTVVLLVIVLAFLLRAMPTWKEVKLRELAVREQEMELRGRIIETVNSSTDVTGRLAEVVKDIAIEQRKATEIVEILQRANSEESDRLSNGVQMIAQQVRTQTVDAETIKSLAKRVGVLETYVRPESATAGV